MIAEDNRPLSSEEKSPKGECDNSIQIYNKLLKRGSRQHVMSMLIADRVSSKAFQ